MIVKIKDKAVLAPYGSIISASKETGINYNGISRCIKGEQLTAGGFEWREYNPAILKLNSHLLYDRYDTLAEASSATGVPPSIIHRALTGDLKLGGGYKWMYEKVSSCGDDINPTFELYPADIKVTSSLRQVDLAWLQNLITTPDESTREYFVRIHLAELMQEWEEKKKLKEKLKFVTPCALTDGKRRRYSNIVQFTGLAHLDFDHLEDAGKFRDYLFEEHSYIVGAWISPSQKAVKALARIPIVNNVPEFKEYFWGLHDVMNMYVGFDIATQNPVLPLFLSNDPSAKFRHDATTFKLKGVNPGHISHEPISIKRDFSSFEEHVILDRISKRIDVIEDNGHPQLRAAAYTLGGFVGAGYVDYNDAVETVYEAIDRNDYLSKGVDGYKLTGKQMIKSGTRAPLEL